MDRRRFMMLAETSAAASPAGTSIASGQMSASTGARTMEAFKVADALGRVRDSVIRGKA